jgi:hypothetical protein
MPARVEEKEIAHGADPTTPREVIEALADRILSDTWAVPDDILGTSIRETREWAEREFGDLDRTINEEYWIVLDIARF